MYVITVQFTVNPANLVEFREAVMEQAKNSLELEDECQHFDVCVAENNPCIVFLYEIYNDISAFNSHLETPHFNAFNERVTPWVSNKIVKSWEKL